jgi:hypothetical protein
MVELVFFIPNYFYFVISRARLLSLANVAVSPVPSKPHTSSIGKSCAFPNSRATANRLFAALHGAQRHERCGIGAIIPPILPPGISDFVCEI